MGILIGLDKVSHEWPGRTVLMQATQAVYEGNRIGVVGRNGDGKSTLLQILAGELIPDRGTVTLRGGTHVGLLAQDDMLDNNATVEQAVVGETPSYVWAADPRTRAIREALLADVAWDTQVKTLSGGQRRRVDLARVLMGTWEVLLLDEPTNHLDMGAIRWLARHLKERWPQGEGALVLVTHDRWFLDEVCESMWEVHDGLIEPFEGGYSAYIQQRVERARQAQVVEDRRQNILRKELNWLAHGAKARTSKPKFRIDAARALIAADPPLRDTIELKRLAVARLGKQVIELKGVSMRFSAAGETAQAQVPSTSESAAPAINPAAVSSNPSQTNEVLCDITWVIGPGERIGILGENGAGKSTLLALMCGQMRPSAGFIKIGKTVKLSVMSQRLDRLSAHNSERVESFLATFKQNLLVDGKPQTPLTMAERLGFSRMDLQNFIGDLSGGQRRRLALLAVLLEAPNVLVLDEPGNDLDTDMLATMESLLDEWPGTLLLVTHDRYLMERVTDDQYALIDGHIRHCPGGVEEYFSLLDARPQKTHSKTSNPERSTQSSAAANKERRDAKRRLSAVERRLEKLRAERPMLEEALASVDPTNFEALLAAQAQLDANLQESDALETEWLTLSENLS